MAITHKLSEFTDMTEEQFKECLGRVDMKAFLDNPTQVLSDCGITLKNGFTIEVVETEEAANALPPNVFPIILAQKDSENLSMENLDKIAGGGTVKPGDEVPGYNGPGGKAFWISYNGGPMKIITQQQYDNHKDFYNKGGVYL